MTLHFQDEVERQPASPSTRPIPSPAPRSSRRAPCGSNRCGPPTPRRRRPTQPRGQERNWTFTCWTPPPRPRSARRSTRSSALRRPGWDGGVRDETRDAIHACRWPRRAGPPAPAAAGAPGRRSRASAGSARARSITSASGSRSLRPTPTASRRSTPCCRPCPAPEARAPRLRRHRLPVQGRRRVVRRSSSAPSARPITMARTATTSRLTEDDAAWLRSPCLGLCDQAPAALLTVAGKQPVERLFGNVDVAKAKRVLRRRSDPDSAAAPRRYRRPVIRRCGCSDEWTWSIPPASTPTGRHGGYEALRDGARAWGPKASSARSPTPS